MQKVVFGRVEYIQVRVCTAVVGMFPISVTKMRTIHVANQQVCSFSSSLKGASISLHVCQFIVFIKLLVIKDAAK